MQPTGVDCQALHLRHRVDGRSVSFVNGFLGRLLDSDESVFSLDRLSALVECLGCEQVDDAASRHQLLDIMCHRFGLETGQSCQLSDTFERDFSGGVHSLARLFGRVGQHGGDGTVMRVPDSKVASLLAEHGVGGDKLPPLHCRQALVFHLLTGACRRSCCAGSACESVKRYFAFPAEITHFLVDVLTSDGSHVFSKEDMVLVTQSLGLKDVYRSRLSVRKMFDSLRGYASHRNAVGAGITTPTNDPFEHFEALPRASLVALCCMHGLPIARSHALMKRDVMKHITEQACVEHRSEQEIGCDDVRSRHAMVSGGSVDLVTDQRDLQVSVLERLVPTVQHVALLNILKALDVHHDPLLSLRRLRTCLKRYVTSMRKGKRRAHTSLSDLQSRSERSGSPCQAGGAQSNEDEWPRIVQGLVKDRVLRGFMHATSSDMLRMFVCACCTARYPVSEHLLQPLSNMDLALLTRPDRREKEGVTVDSSWARGVVFDTVFTCVPRVV